MNYQEHKKLNAYVAKFVMGLPCVSPDEVETKESQGQAVSHLQDAPSYSLDSSLALSIVEHMAQNGFKVSLDRHTAGWSASFDNEEKLILGLYTHEKLPLAVCVAALQAIGINWDFVN